MEEKLLVVGYEHTEDLESEVLTKYLKRKFPFIQEVSGYSLESSGRGSTVSLFLNIYVSPTHFCELLDGRVEKKVINKITKVSSSFIKSVITDWDNQKHPLNIRFFPEINEASILKILDKVREEF